MPSLQVDRVFSLSGNSKEKKSKKQSSSSMDSIEVLSMLFNGLGLETYKTTENCSVRSYHLARKFIFPLLLYISVIDYVIMMGFSVILEKEDLKSNVSYMFGSVVVFLLWHTLYSKRSQLRNLLLRLKSTQRNNGPKGIYIKLLIILNIFNYITYACIVMCMTLIEPDGLNCGFFYYYIVEYCETKPFNIFYLFVKIFIFALPEPFNCLCSILFCASCYRCRVLLSNFRQKIEKIILKKSYLLLKPRIYEEYSDVCAVIREVQEVFSFASLLMFLVNLVRAFNLMITVWNGSISDLNEIWDAVFVIIPEIVFCFMIPFSAAQITIEMKKNKNTFSEFYKNLNLCGDIEKINLKVLENLKETEPIVITAWEMVEFSVTLIPSIIGGFMTYGLLLVNMGEQQNRNNSLTDDRIN